jgi:hypothetical protein
MHRFRTTLGLGLLSAAALSFEITLTRLVAVQQFYHFAFMAVSLAVMAGAASGLLLALRPRHPPLWALAAGFALSVGLAYATLNSLPFDSYSIAWDRRQVGVLFLYFLMAGTPFLMGAWATGACLVDAGPQAHGPYAANLLGSAAGCLLAPALLAAVGGEGSVLGAAAFGLLAAAAFSPRRLPPATFALGALAIMVPAVRPPDWLRLTLSPYKPLAAALETLDARHTLSQWTFQSRLDVVESPALHSFPGLSLKAGGDLPGQVALFLDGEGPLPITDLQPGSPQATSLATRMPESLAFRLRPGAKALVLMPGAGFDAQLALAAGARQVTLAFDDPEVQMILAGRYAAFSAGVLERPDVLALDQPARRALASGSDRYDVILFSLSDPFRPIASGAFSLTEGYPWTVESFRQALNRLAPGGLLVVTRWLGIPPAESPRAWATLLEAVRRQGIADPGTHLIAYRSMRTATMIASAAPFTDAELAATRAFLQRDAFDPIYLPDLRPNELNRFNVLPQDTYHALFLDLLAQPAQTLASYPFDLRPPTDDRPFFFHFFRWGQTPEILRTLGQTWQPFGGSGYLVLLALLALMLVLAIPLALAPALMSRRAVPMARLAGGMAYFACLGGGFMLAELALLQRLTLLLDRPAVALATVLFALLLASGVGSLLSPRLHLRPALAGLCLLLVIMAAAIPAPIQWGLSWPLVPRLGLAALLVAPVGLLMGVPFPSGLRRLELRSPGVIPWAWAVNGAVSGVAGVLAAIVLVGLGATSALLLGALLYGGAWLAARALPDEVRYQEIEGANRTE